MAEQIKIRTRIRRAYAGPPGRQIHYLTAGCGPPLVLFHQSPRSSAEYLPLIARWAETFTVIAPDTPGYGASDPLDGPGVPEMPDFAAAMVGFLDDLGLERTAVYGFHTGASLAVALAGLAPERVASVVANGFALFDAAERDHILANYLPPFRPQWDGSHLAFLWARIREQVVFFPWYDARNEARMRRPMYGPDQMNDQIMDMLLAGDNYRHAYRAAFAFDKAAALGSIKGPLTIMAAAPDPLASHLDRLPELPKASSIERLATNAAAWDRAGEILASVELPAFSASTGQAKTTGPVFCGYCDLEYGQIHYRRAGQAGGPTVILLHDLLSGSRVLEAEIMALAASHDVIAFDLPSHGHSHGQSDGQSVTPAICAEALAAAIDALNLGQVRILSFGHAASIAAALARQLGDRVAALIFADAAFPDDSYRAEYSAGYLPDVTPTPHGGHLLAGWRFARAGALYWPWFRDDIPGIRPIDDSLTPENTHTRFVALWECTARQSPLAPEWFKPPDNQATWLSPDWADHMAGMHKGQPTIAYPGGDSAARLAAMAETLNRD